jgi:branched-subunit amino acid transport protein
MSAAVVILIIGAGTYLERLSFIGIIGDREIPQWAVLPLRFVAPAVFAALVAPAVLLQDDRLELSPAANPQALATLVALLVAWRTRSVAATLVSGMAALWLLQAIL